MQSRPTLIGFEIEDDRLLVPVETDEGTGILVEERARGGHRIAAGWFDLDDAGSQVRQLHGGEGPGDEDAELEHGDCH